jgi:hypothetical protein
MQHLESSSTPVLYIGHTVLKFKCSLLGSSENLMASIKIRLVLLSHLSFVLPLHFIFSHQLSMRFYSPSRVPYSPPNECYYPNNI